jgi:hypothetical protein
MEQNMHMITLMKRLQDRVEGEDKQQISDLLESVRLFSNSLSFTLKSVGISTLTL